MPCCLDVVQNCIRLTLLNPFCQHVPCSINVHSENWAYNIEEMSGWYNYPDYGDPVCSAKPALVSSPSLDGISGKFYVGPTGSYNNCLWPIKLGSNSGLYNFQLDAHYQLSNPSYSEAIEFSSNHP